MARGAGGGTPLGPSAWPRKYRFLRHTTHTQTKVGLLASTATATQAAHCTPRMHPATRGAWCPSPLLRAQQPHALGHVQNPPQVFPGATQHRQPVHQDTLVRPNLPQQPPLPFVRRPARRVALRGRRGLGGGDQHGCQREGLDAFGCLLAALRGAGDDETRSAGKIGRC